MRDRVKGRWSSGGTIWLALSAALLIHTAGAQLAVGMPMAPSTAALAIPSVNGGAHPIAGIGFFVVVEARAADGTTRNVMSTTHVRLCLKTGTGSLGGTLTGTIPAGASQVVISGVTYTTAESGVVVTAVTTSGDELTSGDSSAFTTEPGAIASYTVRLTP
jgi:hypothetical protein